MREVEKTGRTVDEAVASALAELGIRKEDAIIEVLEEPSRGFLGLIGGRDARVRVRAKKTKGDLAKEFLSGLLQRMRLDAAVEVRYREEFVAIDVVGSDLGVLIGRRGETLKNLELLVNLAASKGAGEEKRIIVDVAGYRKRREKEIEEIAREAARRALRTGKSVTLEPMEARDRRVVHMTLQQDSRVTTHSEGEEPFRRVVISPRKRTEQQRQQQ